MPLLTYSDLDGRWLKRFCALGETEQDFLGPAVHGLSLSTRTCNRILRIARTIVDLEGAEVITADHFVEAINYRSLDRQAQTWM